MSPSFITKYVKIKIYKSVILRVVLHECGAWSLTLKEEHRLKAFENRVLWIVFGPNVEKLTGEWRRPYITRSVMTYTPYQIFGCSNLEECDGRDM